MNGASGIPVKGREAEYAAELWLADPSAFWLHPEGPLSDTTPDEWRTRQAEIERQRQAAMQQNPYANVAGLNAPYMQQALMQAQLSDYRSMMNAVPGLLLGYNRNPFGF